MNRPQLRGDIFSDKPVPAGRSYGKKTILINEFNRKPVKFWFRDVVYLIFQLQKPSYFFFKPLKLL